MRGVLYSICIIILSLLSSCKEDLPLPQENEVVFSASMSLDGQLKSWEAGKEEVNMIPTLSLEADDFRAYTGRFEGSSSKGQLSFSIYDVEASPLEENAKLDQIFPLERILYLNQNDPALDKTWFKFRGLSAGKAPRKFFWDFGDGTESTESEPLHQYQQSGTYTVELGVEDGTGCWDFSRQEVKVGSEATDCRVAIRYTYNADGSIQFEADYDSPNGQQPALIWSMGDGNSIENQTSFSYNYDHQTISEVSLIAEIGDDICSDIKRIYTRKGASCVSFIEYRASRPNPLAGRVQIAYTAPDGTYYSTNKFIGQPAASTFRILEAEPYEEAFDGRSTYRIKAEFDGILYNPVDENQKIVIENGQATFAVSLPRGIQ